MRPGRCHANWHKYGGGLTRQGRFIATMPARSSSASPGSPPDATLRPAIATVIDRCRRPIGGKRRAIDSPSSPLAWRKEQSWTWIRASQLLLGFGLNLDSAPFRLSETAGSHRRDDDRAGEDVPDIGVDVHLCQPVAEHAKNQDSGESGQNLRLALLSHRLS